MNVNVHVPYLHFGQLHIPVYGIFAALGLMAALAASQRTARCARLAPEAVWSAGMATIVTAFVVSRLLLVAFNLRSFFEYPLQILALPSLNASSIVLTGLFMLAYIRWQRLPLLPLVDAVAPCVALLSAFLSLGRYFEGTRDGMPTQLPWGIQEPLSGPVHPVEVYTFVAAAFIGAASLCVLQRTRTAGVTTAIFLITSGLSIFFIDFFRLPSELFDRSPLEGSQIIAIAMILVGAALLLRAATWIERESRTEPPHAV